MRSALRIFLILILFCSLSSFSRVWAPLTYFSLQPYYLKVGGPGTSFSLNMTLSYASNVYAWDFKMYYETAILRCTSVAEGRFLKDEGETFLIRNIKNDYNTTHGQISVACSLLGNVPGVSGSGVIATLTFETVQLGISYLEVEDTKLSDPYSNPISHINYDGLVEVIQVPRNIVVTNVVADMAEAYVGQPVNISVSVANEGEITETFNVTIYGNESVLSSQTIAGLHPGSNTTVMFTWQTVGTSPGESYVIKAVSQALVGESNLEDNVFVDGTVRMMAGIHDVAVEDVAVSAYEVYEKQEVDIFVKVKNKGNFYETFNVTAYFGEQTISYQTVSVLAPSSETDLDFVWNTTGFPVNVSYSVKAVASPVEGEANLADNTFEDGMVRILPRAAPAIKILEVVPCNQFGESTSSFKTRSIAHFKVVISAVAVESEQVLVTINVFDAAQTTIGVVSIQGPIVEGTSFFILGLPVPASAHVGTSFVYANVFNDWPHRGGVPYCPEKSASFEIQQG